MSTWRILRSSGSRCQKRLALTSTGNAVRSDGPLILSNDPNDANGGLRYYHFDNESGVWHSRHQDLHPGGADPDQQLADEAATSSHCQFHHLVPLGRGTTLQGPHAEKCRGSGPGPRVHNLAVLVGRDSRERCPGTDNKRGPLDFVAAARDPKEIEL